MSSHSRIYFHSPCFDGIVSAILAWDFGEKVLKWTVEDLQPVNYKLRSSWLRETLVEPCAVVDFLYHPQASFWADHHATTFLTPEAKRDFKQKDNPHFAYDPKASSCAQLLWGHLKTAFGYRNRRYAPLVAWATKTDAARYASVQEAIEGTAPALRINCTLAYGDGDGYSVFLVRQLRNEPVEVVAGLPEVRTRYERFQNDVHQGLELFESRARLERGVVVFDLKAENTLVPRYAPYYFFPNAPYSAGIIRRDDTTTITAMRNPWRRVTSIHLGRLFERFGGGGHPRVGSVVLRDGDTARAEGLFQEVLTVLQGRFRRTPRLSGTHSR